MSLTIFLPAHERTDGLRVSVSSTCGWLPEHILANGIDTHRNNVPYSRAGHVLLSCSLFPSNWPERREGQLPLGRCPVEKGPPLEGKDQLPERSWGMQLSAG